MRVLLDTNVLLRAAQPSHAHAEIAVRAMRGLASQRHELCIVPQVLYEFWVVATRPAADRGIGLSVAEAHAEVDRLSAALTFLDDRPGIFDRWLALVSGAQTKGKAAHDARLVAAMSAHGLTRVLTFNGSDFIRYAGITVLAPDAVDATPPL